jgi:5'-nucleotidase
MHILVTNDDGVTAPGLMALAEAMRQIGRASIVAPDHDWSGGGHVKTLPILLCASTLHCFGGEI